MIDFTKFGLAPEDTAATLIHRCADQFTVWQDYASPVQKGWVTADLPPSRATPSVLLG